MSWLRLDLDLNLNISLSKRKGIRLFTKMLNCSFKAPLHLVCWRLVSSVWLYSTVVLVVKHWMCRFQYCHAELTEVTSPSSLQKYHNKFRLLIQGFVPKWDNYQLLLQKATKYKYKLKETDESLSMVKFFVCGRNTNFKDCTFTSSQHF